MDGFLIAVSLSVSYVPYPPTTLSTEVTEPGTAIRASQWTSMVAQCSINVSTFDETISRAVKTKLRPRRLAIELLTLAVVERPDWKTKFGKIRLLVGSLAHNII